MKYTPIQILYLSKTGCLSFVESQAGEEAEPVSDKPPGGEEENPTEEAVPEAEGQAGERGGGMLRRRIQ